MQEHMLSLSCRSVGRWDSGMCWSAVAVGPMKLYQCCPWHWHSPSIRGERGANKISRLQALHGVLAERSPLMLLSPGPALHGCVM
ncbi:unnamed protein product [Arctogadus glacialis]